MKLLITKPVPVSSRILILALYLGVAIVQTWPLLGSLLSHVPFGNYPASTTVRWQLWAMWWNGVSLTSGYGNYWNAPILFPEQLAFAFSEPQWLTGLLFNPIYWISGSSALAYNLTLFSVLILNGWCGYLLLCRLKVRSSLAIVGGVLFEILPIAADQLGLVQTIVVFPCLMALVQLVVMVSPASGSTLRPFLLCAFWLAVCFYTGSHTALLFGPVIAGGIVVLLGRRLLQRDQVLAALAAVILIAVLVGPFALSQMEALQRLDMEEYRPEAVIGGTSASLDNYLQMPATNLLRQRSPDRAGHTLGLGLVVWPMALAGAYYGWKRRRFRRWTLFCLLATAGCVLLSFGPNPPSPLSWPYEVLREVYPGFGYTRNLWRYGGVAQLFIAVFAVMGLALLRIRWRRRRWLATAAFALLVVDWVSTPVPLLDLRPNPEDTAWVEWLRQTPPETRIIHLPLVASGRADEFELTTYLMNRQMEHGRTMVNGYTSFMPLKTQALEILMSKFPHAASVTVLRRLEVDYVLVDEQWREASADRYSVWRDHLELVERMSGTLVYRITPSGS